MHQPVDPIRRLERIESRLDILTKNQRHTDAHLRSVARAVAGLEARAAMADMARMRQIQGYLDA